MSHQDMAILGEMMAWYLFDTKPCSDNFYKFWHVVNWTNENNSQRYLTFGIFKDESNLERDDHFLGPTLLIHTYQQLFTD